jgi:hypothetical protein
MKDWTSIPDEYIQTWQDIFQASRTGLDQDAPCPVCGARTLHKFLHYTTEEHRVIDGIEFKAKAAGWEWCSSCHTFEHYQAFVPIWWTPEPLDFDPKKLTALPDELERAVQRRNAGP